MVFVHLQVALETAGDLTRHQGPDEEVRGLSLVRLHEDAGHREREEVRAQLAARVRVHDVAPLPADAA